jgi:hypothetical protein
MDREKIVKIVSNALLPYWNCVANNTDYPETVLVCATDKITDVILTALGEEKYCECKETRFYPGGSDQLEKRLEEEKETGVCFQCLKPIKSIPKPKIETYIKIARSDWELIKLILNKNT